MNIDTRAIKEQFYRRIKALGWIDVDVEVEVIQTSFIFSRQEIRIGVRTRDMIRQVMEPIPTDWSNPWSPYPSFRIEQIPGQYLVQRISISERETEYASDGDGFLAYHVEEMTHRFEEALRLDTIRNAAQERARACERVKQAVEKPKKSRQIVDVNSIPTGSEQPVARRQITSID